MKTLRQFAAILLVLLSGAAPAMACMVSGALMTVEEQACCRAMRAQCGQMQMPLSHECCRKVPATAHDNALKTNSASTAPAFLVAFCTSPFDLLAHRASAQRGLSRPEHSPPKPPPATCSLLRI